MGDILAVIMAILPMYECLPVLCIIEVSFRALIVAVDEVTSSSVSEIAVWVKLELSIRIGWAIFYRLHLALNSFLGSPERCQLDTNSTVGVSKLDTTSR
jgi:formate-dependent nitrite reductase membrane component NrfD